METLSTLVNIGEKLERQLHKIGIDSYEELALCGSRQVWLKLKENDANICLNHLMVLEGAIQKIRWYDLDDAIKDDLKAFYKAHQ